MSKKTHYVKRWDDDGVCGVEKRLRNMGTFKLRVMRSKKKEHVDCGACLRVLSDLPKRQS